jgi:hypothetical protein
MQWRLWRRHLQILARANILAITETMSGGCTRGPTRRAQQPAAQLSVR